MPSDDIFSMTRRWDFYKNILIIRLISIDLTCRSEFVYLYCSEWVKNIFVQPTKIIYETAGIQNIEGRRTRGRGTQAVSSVVNVGIN